MSFGGHLEELRVTLFKVLAALLVGSLVGFAFAKPVVQFVNAPLKAALEDFERQNVTDQFEKHIESLRAAGKPVPTDLETAKQRYADEGLLPEVLMVDPDAIKSLLGALGSQADADPEATKDPEAKSEKTPGKLVPLTIYAPAEQDSDAKLIGTGIPDGLMIYVKAALMVGAIVASPLIFYFIWSFVASGLYKHERRYIYVFMPFSIVLFLLGAGLAFFFVFKYVLSFLFGFYAWLEITPNIRIGEWLNFALLLPLGFGVGFQLPLVMLFLERIGIATVKFYLQHWRYAVLVIFILSMLLTPADPQSMLLLAVPMTLLYFGGILLCHLMPRRKTPFGDPVG